MHIKRLLFLAVLSALPLAAQIPAPQINLTGNIGCQGFPCVNSGTLIMSADADRTMTALETSAFYLKVTSSVPLTATRNLIAPLGNFPFTIENATTGGQSIQIIGPSGTGVTVPNGQVISVWNDGTNYVAIGGSAGAILAAPGTANQTITYNNNGASTLTIANPNAGSGASSGYLASNGTDFLALELAGTGTSIPGAGSFVLSNATAPLAFQTGGGPILFNAPNTNISGALNYAADTGSANAYVVAPPSCVSATHAGTTINFKAANASTGASTLVYCTGSPVTLEKNGSTALTTGDILANAQYSARFDGANWQLLNSSLTGSSLPTATAAGQIPAATGAGTTYNAINISKIPVEFYGATPYTSEAAAEAGPDDTSKFQSAVTAAVNGLATCQAGMYYHVEGPVNFSSFEGLIGTSMQTYQGGHCNLVTNSASTKVLSAVGSSGAYLAGVTWAHLTIYRSTAGTGTSAGFYSSFAGGGIVTDTLSYDSIYDYYRHASPGYGIGYWSYNQAGWILGESTGTYYGFYDDSADGYAENSIVTSHSAVACQNLTGSATSYAQILTGEAINDNDTYDFYSAGCSYGQVANYTGSGNSFATNDIHWITSTHDGVGVSCYKISNTSLATDGYVEINGGHCNSSVSGSALVDIESSYGVKVAGVNINQHNGFGASHALYAASSSGIIWANNTVTNFGTTNTAYAPLEWTGVTHSAATGNTVYAYSTNAGNIFWITGNSTYNSVTGNNLSGYSTAGAGIGIDSGSNFNQYSANSIDLTHITSGVPIGDSGTANGASASSPGIPVLKVTNTATGTGGYAAYFSSTATGSNLFATLVTQGQMLWQGNKDATPSEAVSFAYGVPGSLTGNNPYFNFYNGSAWAGAWFIDSTTGNTNFVKSVVVPSIGQTAASSTGGTCAMSTSTSCTITLGHTYTTPVCIVTQQSATLTGGAAGCTVSGTTVTITAAVANSETWGALVFGNPS